MQKKVEDLLRDHLPTVNSKSGSVVVLDPNNGEIKAMANFPTYDPAQFSKVSDAAVFTNPSVSAPLEIGSSMKTLTVAAGLNEGVITPATTFMIRLNLRLIMKRSEMSKKMRAADSLNPGHLAVLAKHRRYLGIDAAGRRFNK